ncbi:MAG TPA: energy transducer TonB [Candidatus Limnocylindrales bacterium]|nr:energy transducer TonB [Candidatus Limnocylindrales bacterium]
MADQSQPNNPFPNADDHLSRLFNEDVEAPWYRSLFANIKEIINPPKLPPLELTSKPVAVKDIWGLYGRQKKSFMMSTGFQLGVVALLFTVLSSHTVRDQIKKTVTIIMPADLAPPPVAPAKKQTMQGGGGGGDRSLLAASKGKLPKAAVRQFVPPSAVVNNTAPKLSMDPSILADPNVPLPNINMPNYGDPLGKIGPPSNGTGSGGGIGSGKGGGVGSGSGGGVGPGEGGGFGGGVYKVGGGVSAPTLLFKKEPEYSEEARKAKYQGTVTLYVEVGVDGKATNIKVLHSLGLGLDEKAIEAVKQWKFKPGMKDGKPVPVAASIEVNFRLL